MEKNVFALVLKIAYSNTRTHAHSQAVVLLVAVLKVRKILLSSNTSSKANYGLCAETGKTAAVMTNFSGFTKSTELLTAVIFGTFAAVFFFFFVFFFNRPYFRTLLKSRIKIRPERNGWKLCVKQATNQQAMFSKDSAECSVPAKRSVASVADVWRRATRPSAPGLHLEITVLVGWALNTTY